MVEISTNEGEENEDRQKASNLYWNLFWKPFLWNE
jgi:hypothetical protein